VTEQLPERGRVFEQSHRIRPEEVGADGAAHLHAVANWLQDVAYLDALDAGVLEAHAWIVRRTTIRIEALPGFSESLRLRTFCAGIAASVADRRTVIDGDQGARIEAEAIWVQVDPATRRPTRFSDRFLDVYRESAAGRRARSRLRHPAPAADAERIGWSFRTADIDFAGHVNNAAYWQIAEQHLPGAGDGGRLEIEFRAGANAGEASLLRSADRTMLWVLDADDTLSASIARG
jgi:acyl-ACP thioesterase